MGFRGVLYFTVFILNAGHPRRKQTRYTGEPDIVLFSKLIVIIKLYNWFTSFKLKSNLYFYISDGL
jgi:hypothetical protein